MLDASKRQQQAGRPVDHSSLSAISATLGVVGLAGTLFFSFELFVAVRRARRPYRSLTLAQLAAAKLEGERRVEVRARAVADAPLVGPLSGRRVVCFRVEVDGPCSAAFDELPAFILEDETGRLTVDDPFPLGLDAPVLAKLSARFDSLPERVTTPTRRKLDAASVALLGDGLVSCREIGVPVGELGYFLGLRHGKTLSVIGFSQHSDFEGNFPRDSGLKRVARNAIGLCISLVFLVLTVGQVIER